MTSREATEALAILPYQILLKDEDWTKRRGVAEALYESGDPEACKLLRRSLADPDERVRLFAAQALELLAERYQNMIGKLRSMTRLNPTDVFLRTQISFMLVEFAANCLESNDVRRHVLEEAREHLAAALQTGPVTAALLLRMGQVCQQIGDRNSARSALESIKPEDREYTMARFGLAEMWMDEGYPHLVRQELGRIKDRALPPAVKEAVLFWCGA